MNSHGRVCGLREEVLRNECLNMISHILIGTLNLKVVFLSKKVSPLNLQNTRMEHGQDGRTSASI